MAVVTGIFRRYVVDYRRFCLYERHHRILPEAMFRPRLEQYEEHFVCSNAEADALAREHEDFRSLTRSAWRALDSGAVAFCVYVGREVAHVAWLSTSVEGRRALDGLGYTVRFDEKEAWTGAARTVPEYRGKGLLHYSHYRRFQYLLDQGYEISRTAVELTNAASRHANERFEPRVYGIGRQWRVFGKRWWSERAVRLGERV